MQQSGCFSAPGPARDFQPYNLVDYERPTTAHYTPSFPPKMGGHPAMICTCQRWPGNCTVYWHLCRSSKKTRGSQKCDCMGRWMLRQIAWSSTPKNRIKGMEPPHDALGCFIFVHETCLPDSSPFGCRNGTVDEFSEGRRTCPCTIAQSNPRIKYFMRLYLTSLMPSKELKSKYGRHTCPYS